MKEFVFILPNQLYHSHPALKKGREVVLIEHPHFFSSVQFHKQKLILHRASMKEYEVKLKSSGYIVHYAEYKKNVTFTKFAKSLGAGQVHLVDPLDITLDQEIHALKKVVDVSILKSPGFYLDRQEALSYFSKQSSFRMHYFYQKQRKEFNVLVDSNLQPIGGKWSFDYENRKSLPKEFVLPEIPKPNNHKSLKEAYSYIEKKIPKAIGSASCFFYPINRLQALRFLKQFFEHRFSLFGDYQDAIHHSHPTLFHSLLSSSLNIGLLTAKEVVAKALDFAKDNEISLNALEGFIRQVLGWREFVLGVYLTDGKKMKASNYFGATRLLPTSFYSGTTGIIPFDDTVKKSLTYAYAHHIERLMVAGNFFLLCEIHPMQVYKWFSELYIDAYDWVMVPNALAMSQFADAGKMVTKPYISSSNYIRKMSDYKKGEWSVVWDALYWRFVDKHKEKLSHNRRFSFVLSNLSKMGAGTLNQHKEVANTFLSNLK